MLSRLPTLANGNGVATDPKQIQGPRGPKAYSVPDGVFAFMEILFSLQAASSILAACADVVAGIGRISGVGGRVGILVQDNQGTDYSWNPSTARQDHHNQERAAALVHHSQWGKDD